MGEWFKIKKQLFFYKSIRTKLFISLCAIVIAIIVSLIIMNNYVLRQFYEYNKEKQLENVFNLINNYYKNNTEEEKIFGNLDELALQNNFDILIKDNNNISIYSSNKDFYSSINEIFISFLFENRGETFIIKNEKNYKITKFKDKRTNITYIVFIGNLDNSYGLYIKMPVTSIEESVKISNEFLSIIAVFVIVIGGIVLSIVSKRFSEPIVELNQIAKKMSNLDFSKKYKISNKNDEIDMLGISINTLSNKLETTINQLKKTNLELEKDIEEKSKIDEMRKSFISDVSHELKTPIALIQGYSEGLIENVNSDEESKKFYAEVILDEATKMDKLVKQLLELMKLEYGKMIFNKKEFNIVELENEIIRKSLVMAEKENVEIENKVSGEIVVFSDDFYIDQILTNFITNAIKYATEINGEKKVIIENKLLSDKKKVRIKVFNTYVGFTEEQLRKIWNRFYKLDESRNRENGGNGIGLSLVKAIMNNLKCAYGVKNVAGGVEFYFELDLK